MGTLKRLQEKMEGAKIYERTGIINGVYKQIVSRDKWKKVYTEGESGRKEIEYVKHPRQGKGEYRDFAERSDENREKLGKYVFSELKKYGFDNSAERLYEQVLSDLISYGDLMDEFDLSDYRESPAVVSSLRGRHTSP